MSVLIERVTCTPSQGTPEVIPGEPQAGDLVRVTSGKAVHYEIFAGNPQVTPPEFKTISGSQFIAICASAIGFARVDQLLLKSPTVSALIQKADRVDRNSGNTPAALAYLMTVDNALTQDELADIDAAWKAL